MDIIDCILWLGEDSALINFPIDEHTLDARLVSCGKFFPGLPCIAQIVTFCHLSLIDIRKKRCESLEFIVGLLEQLSDGYWVVKTSGESQQH